MVGKMEDRNYRPPDLFGRNPLLNSVVMSRVFDFVATSPVTVEEIRNYRSVCQVWYKESSKVWRSVATLRLGLYQPWRSDLAAIKPYLSIREYMKMIKDPDQSSLGFGRKPFSKYVLYGINFCAPIACLKVSFHRKDQGQCHLGNFWDLIGPSIKEIKFENCKFHGEKPYVFEEIFVRKLPNLETLSLKDNHMVSPGTSTRKTYYGSKANRQLRYSPTKLNLKTLELDGDVPLHIMHFMIESPNLKTLRVQNPVYALDFCRMELFCHLRIKKEALQVRPTAFQVKELDVMNSPSFFQNFNCSCGTEDTTLFNHFDVRPECISVTLVPPPPDNWGGSFIGNADNVTDFQNVLTPLLTYNKTNLRVLKVFRPPIFHAYRFSFEFIPAIPNLEELYLWGNVTTNLNFLLSMRQLRVLYINNSGYDKADQYQRMYFGKKEESETKNLFRKRYKPFKGELLAQTRSYFFGRGELPYLQDVHLDCHVSKTLVWALFQWASNLKRFKANLNRAGFRSVCKYASNLEELVVLFDNSVDDEAITGKCKSLKWRRINITNLTKLKRFELKADCGKSLLGSDSVYDGFLEMSSLKVIHICVSEAMSTEAEAALKKHIKVVSVIRNYGANSHGDEECCQRKAFVQNYLAD